MSRLETGPTMHRMAPLTRRVRSFDFALSCAGAPDAIAVPSRAEVIGLNAVLHAFGDVMAQPLPQRWAYDERFVFTHFVAVAGHGFLLGGESTT